MKLKMKFEISVRCRKFECSNENTPALGDTDIELELNISSASNILFKFGPTDFIVDGHNGDKYICRAREIGGKPAIMLSDSEYNYIVKSPNVFFAEVLQGYDTLRVLNKMNTLMQFTDLNSADDDNEEVVDEFDLEQERG